MEPIGGGGGGAWRGWGITEWQRRADDRRLRASIHRLGADFTSKLHNGGSNVAIARCQSILCLLSLVASVHDSLACICWVLAGAAVMMMMMLLVVVAVVVVVLAAAVMAAVVVVMVLAAVVMLAVVTVVIVETVGGRYVIHGAREQEEREMAWLTPQQCLEVALQYQYSTTRKPGLAAQRMLGAMGSGKPASKEAYKWTKGDVNTVKWYARTPMNETMLLLCAGSCNKRQYCCSCWCG